MTDTSGFAKMVPGFDFLQNLVKSAGTSIPAVGQWVAPTLDPAELEKRIEELRTVQFWLEQNARMLAATIQALEVQRMTLSTLKTMNVQMSDLQESMKIKVPESEAPAAAAQAQGSAAAPPAAATAKSEHAESAESAAAVDPAQWWGALTKQFTELATNAIQQGPGKGLAAAMGRSSVDGVADSAAAKKSAGASKKSARKSPGKRRSASAKKTKD